MQRIFVEFKVDNPNAARFKIFGNGKDYGIFEYGRPFYTIGPFNGDGRTEYEIIIQDLENPNCKDFTTIGPIICTPNADCQINYLRADVSDCLADGSVEIGVKFEFDNPTNRGFNVFIDERYIDTFFSKPPVYFHIHFMNAQSAQ